MSAAPHTARQHLLAQWSRQVREAGHEPSLIERERRITIDELDRWSDAIASMLIARGVGIGSVVAILTERSAVAISSMLAVVKIGAAYLPIETQLPAQRRRSMIDTTRPAALVSCSPDTAAFVAEQGLADTYQVIFAPPWEAFIATEAVVAPVEQRPRWHDLPGAAGLYLLFTSGSSGEPKAVVGTRGGLMNRLEWMWSRYPLQANERLVHKTALSFVDAVAEIWSALLSGIPLVLLDAREAQDLDLFIQRVADERITRIVLVPSLLRALLSTPQDLARRWAALRFCVCSGEALTAPIALECRRRLPYTTLINLYGMTEAAADATCSEVAHVTGDATVPIGTAIDGMEVLILDEDLAAVPAGQTGQLFIGGVGLAQGYYARPAATARVFIPDPRPMRPGARLYATGDFGRWSDYGQLEYAGRRDTQVKVRGHRVELIELERNALLHPSVAECVALVSEEIPEDIQLFVRLHDETELLPLELKAFLASRIPGYMQPSFVHVRHRFPYLVNGKVDRRALLKTDRTMQLDGEPPRSGVERQIALLWQELLRSDLPTRTSRFFDLGGNSLKAALLVTRLRAQFGVELSLTEFLESADLTQLARLIDRRLAVQRLAAAPGNCESGELLEL
jgi:amino acid adenylation domain-containing protein